MKPCIHSRLDEEPTVAMRLQLKVSSAARVMAFATLYERVRHVQT